MPSQEPDRLLVELELQVARALAQHQTALLEALDRRLVPLQASVLALERVVGRLEQADEGQAATLSGGGLLTEEGHQARCPAGGLVARADRSEAAAREVGDRLRDLERWRTWLQGAARGFAIVVGGPGILLGLLALLREC